jgi:hypothetical protein
MTRRGFRRHNTDFAGSKSVTDQSACEERREDSGNLPKSDVRVQEIVEYRLTDESFHGDQTFGDRVDGEQETLKGHGPEQSGSRGSN